MLVLYTDGVTEAMTDLEEEFGVPRLEQVIRENLARSADEIVTAIQQAVEAFTGDVLPFDDVTLVVLKRNAE